MTLRQRTVYTTFRRPDNSPIEGVVSTFTLSDDSYTADETVVPAPVEMVSDASGYASAQLWAEQDGLKATKWQWKISGITASIQLDLEYGDGSPVNLSVLRTSSPTVPTSSLQAVLDTHATVIASTTQLGHVKVDGTSIIINGSGVISAVGGGGGAVSSVNGQTGTVTLTAASVGADPAGTSSSALTGHTGATDPHTQYYNQTRGDARYAQATHTHTASQISDASANGRSLITASDYAAMRKLLMVPISVSLITEPYGTQWAVPSALTTYAPGGGPYMGIYVDLTEYTEARLTSPYVGCDSGTPSLALLYKNGASWAYLNGSNGPAFTVSTTYLPRDSGWVTITAAAKTLTTLTLGGSGGNGTANTYFGNVHVWLR